MTKSRKLIAKRKPWTPVELELLRRNYADSLTKDLATVLNRPQGTVHQKANKLGLFKSLDFTSTTTALRQRDLVERGVHKGFLKGHVPATKGLRRPGWSAGDMQRTQFQRGRPASEARNYVPLGSHRVSKDGRLECKVTDDPTLAPVRRWVGVHRLVWIEANGPVPEAHVVAFKPGRATTDPTLITPCALELLTQAENMARNRAPPELQRIHQLRGVLTRAINKRIKSEAPHDE